MSRVRAIVLRRVVSVVPVQAVPLLLFHCVALVAVVFGRTYDLRNRNAGLISVTVSLLLCLMVLSLRERRALLTTAITVAGLAAAAVAYSATDPMAIDPTGYKGWHAQAVADRWPHFDDASVFGFAARFGIVPLRLTANTVGIFAMAVPLAALVALVTSRRWWQRVFWLAVAALGGVIVLGSASRGSTAGMVTGAAVLAGVAAVPRPRGRLVAGLAMYLGALLVAIALSEVDPRLSGRASLLWPSLLSEPLTDPWLGAYGAFANRHPDASNAHNVVLETLVDLGWVGVVAFVMAALTGLVAAARLLRHAGFIRSEVGAERMALLTVSYLAALSVAGNIDSLLTLPVHLDTGFITVLVPLIPMVLAAPLALGDRAADGARA